MILARFETATFPSLAVDGVRFQWPAFRCHDDEVEFTFD
jgi:hypothetical protein